MKRPRKKESSKRDCELVYAGKEPEKSILTSTPGVPLEPLKTFGRAKGGWSNILVSGDNLPVLKTLLEMKKAGRLKNSDGSKGVRLVYIDPPFSTNLKFKGKKDQKAYEDKIVGAEFLEFLRKRLVLLRELLSDDGSIFVHLDWKKAHYAKVVLDEVFGEENFLNDIIWSYGGRGAKAVSSMFSRNHDIILWYRGSSHVFNRIYVEKRIRKGEGNFRQDEDGRWFKTSPRGDYTDRSVEALLKENRVYRTKNGTVRIKYFLKEDGEHLIEDKLVGDVWDDIPDAMHLSESEKTGYPTQKPESLPARILKAATHRGDLVLDAFCGAGTTLAAAEKLGRRWIGIDSGKLAIHTIEKRMLLIKDSKDIENPKKRYGKAASPFILFEGHSEGCVHEGEPTVECAYSHDETTDEFVIKIEKFGSPEKGRFKNLETLSTVMLDYDFNGEVFNFSELFTAEELKEKGYEIRFPSSRVKGEIMMIYSDIFGNERWFVGEAG